MQKKQSIKKMGEYKNKSAMFRLQFSIDTIIFFKALIINDFIKKS